MSATNGAGEQGGHSGGKVAFGWALVSIPLAYGVVETLIRVSNLFTS